MTAAHRLNLISIEDYLAGELVSPVRHEYRGGALYALAHSADRHDLIATNVKCALRARLRGTPCRVYNSETKIRIRNQADTRFYYPDTSIVCRQNAPTESFQDEPEVLVEVLSDATRRIDEVEKRDAYLTIPSLQIYLLVEQDSPAVLAYRRCEQFSAGLFEGLDAVIPLDEVGIDLPLSEIYKTIQFSSEVTGEV